jgi:hypothetical protein
MNTQRDCRHYKCAQFIRYSPCHPWYVPPWRLYRLDCPWVHLETVKFSSAGPEASHRFKIASTSTTLLSVTFMIALDGLDPCLNTRTSPRHGSNRSGSSLLMRRFGGNKNSTCWSRNMVDRSIGVGLTIIFNLSRNQLRGCDRSRNNYFSVRQSGTTIAIGFSVLYPYPGTSWEDAIEGNTILPECDNLTQRKPFELGYCISIQYEIEVVCGQHVNIRGS